MFLLGASESHNLEMWALDDEEPPIVTLYGVEAGPLDPALGVGAGSPDPAL